MNDTKIQSQVARIIQAVRKGGDRAVCSLILKYDRVKISPARLRVEDSAFRRIEVDREYASAVRACAENIRAFHTREMSSVARRWRHARGNVLLGQDISALESACIYVPGGRFSYPSTVLMAAIPAKIAGVGKVIITTPPSNVTPQVLFAARVAGVTEVYRVGGPAAIAAFACGTQSVPKVDIIAGPGNAYVTEAKRQVFGSVGIDMLAGPSEVAIICDSSADPRFVAADLLAQTEHDPMARGCLFCDSGELIGRVRRLLPAGSRRQVAFSRKSIRDAVAAVNRLAPEHLEIICRRPEAVLRVVRNAGAVFVGGYSPAVAGDYAAGPSHVLPTGGAARFSSGLSVQTFLKRSSFVKYNRAGLAADSPAIETMAAAEGLSAHAAAAKARNAIK